MSERMRLFHKLWTAAVGSPGYVKADWRQLGIEIEQLERDATIGATLRRIAGFKS